MELQRHLAEFRAAGVRLFAVSYDSQEVIRTFTEHYGVEYDVLSDEGSRVIKALGILNTLVQPDEPVYGIPYPGTFVLDAAGIVIAKFFNREYQVRESAPFLIRAALGQEPSTGSTPAASAAPMADGVAVTAHLLTEDLKFRQRSMLMVELVIPEGLHLYGRPTPEGYYPVDVRLTAPDGLQAGATAFPAARPFRVESLDEDFYVYDGTLRVTVEVSTLLREDGSLPVDIEVSYQACSDIECFIPTTARLHLDMPVGRLTPQAPTPSP